MSFDKILNRSVAQFVLTFFLQYYCWRIGLIVNAGLQTNTSDSEAGRGYILLNKMPLVIHRYLGQKKPDGVAGFFVKIE